MIDVGGCRQKYGVPKVGLREGGLLSQGSGVRCCQQSSHRRESFRRDIKRVASLVKGRVLKNIDSPYMIVPLRE